ncbi:MAG TPA: hypothetical protein RMI62_24300, partial [Polyangiaceae bacterium LLY-WYZ-15_(1-7)]|nr:hypothetical protein [Polyangiaceae bacterium LLY-WYZ-15_(1-7)]
MRWIALTLVTALAVGCGDDDGGAPEDAGTTDAAMGDAGGELDAGPAPVTCDATEDDVLASTADAEAEAGAVLLCTPPSDLAATSLQEDAAFHGYEGPTLEVDARRWVFSFATPRADGDPALSSARLFLPAAEPEAPLPLVVLAHPTTGLGDVCAPTRMDARDPSNQDTARLLNPLVGTGHAVVAPDYIGLGTEGVHGFLNPEETATTLLDAARAA